MRRRNNEDQKLDEILSEIRKDEASPSVIAAAASRVRARLGMDGADAGEGAPIEACVGFRSLMDAHLGGTLGPARSALLEDHVRECLACRKALRAAREVSDAATAEGAARRPRSTIRIARWGIAAAVLGAALLVGIWWMGAPPDGPAAEIASIEGTLFRLAADGLEPLEVGDTVQRGDSIRTRRNSGAVLRLRDGSRVEMSHRSELSISERRNDATIRLTMGNVIVEAAPRSTGHLEVRTGDCVVSVTGTIFAVNRGLKGSRVSVLEGSVRVSQGTSESLLRPGDQITTHPSVGRVPVDEEIAWSRDVDRYAAVLAELHALGRELDRTVFRHGVRYSTRLLDRMPAGTAIYAAIPNLGVELDEAHRRLQERMADSDVLREWWESRVVPSGGARVLESAIRHVAALGSHLGDEIALGFRVASDGEVHGPLLVAQVEDPKGFREAVRTLVEEAGVDASALGLLDDPIDAGVEFDVDDGLCLRLVDGLVVASPDRGEVRRFTTDSGAPGSFAASGFHARIAEVYEDGADWLFAADIRTILESTAGDDEDALRVAGILDVEHLVVEARDEEDETRHRVLLTFGGPRRGIASWLAAPTPMGSLSFVSPEATLAAAFAVKDPALLLEDLYALLGASDPAALAEARSQSRFLEEVADALGGEFAVALDGPVFPVPAWKIVVEVYDPNRLQTALEALVVGVRDSVPDLAESGLRIERVVADGRVYHVVRADASPLAIHWTFVDGYFLAGPQRAVLDRAIRQREAGFVLSGSSGFRKRMPSDAHPNFSAVAYQAIGPTLAPLAERLASSPDAAPPERRAALETFARGIPTGLTCAYAEEDRIVLAGTKEGGLGLNLSTMLGFGGPNALGLVLEETINQMLRGQTPGETLGS